MPPPKRQCIKPASFSMIYWKQQLILIKPSQNIKLIEPTAVVGIHNSWSKSFKIFIRNRFSFRLWKFFPILYFYLDIEITELQKKEFLNLWNKVLNCKVSQFKKIINQITYNLMHTLKLIPTFLECTLSDKN